MRVRHGQLDGGDYFTACEHQVDRHRHGHHDARSDEKNARAATKHLFLPVINYIVKILHSTKRYKALPFSIRYLAYAQHGRGCPTCYANFCLEIWREQVRCCFCVLNQHREANTGPGPHPTKHGGGGYTLPLKFIVFVAEPSLIFCTSNTFPFFIFDLIHWCTVVRPLCRLCQCGVLCVQQFDADCHTSI